MDSGTEQGLQTEGPADGRAGFPAGSGASGGGSDSGGRGDLDGDRGAAGGGAGAQHGGGAGYPAGARYPAPHRMARRHADPPPPNDGADGGDPDPDGPALKSRHLLDSFRFAVDGLIYVLHRHRHMRYHFLLGAVVLLISAVLSVTRVELVLLCLAIALLIMAE